MAMGERGKAFADAECALCGPLPSNGRSMVRYQKVGVEVPRLKESAHHEPIFIFIGWHLSPSLAILGSWATDP